MAFADRPSYVWRLRTRPLGLGERTRLMAIVNITPDSFSGDGTLQSQDQEAANGRLQRRHEYHFDLYSIGV